MRIAINGTFWAEPHVGSGQYLHHLVAALTRVPSDHRWVLVIPRYTRVTKPVLPGWQVIMMPTPFDRRNRNLAKLWFEQVAFGQACRKLRVDLAHVPYLAPPYRSARPIIVTVHDLIPLLLPTNRGNRAVQLYMRLALAGVRRAALVIADSEHTRQDIVTHLGLPPAGISVTHLAAAPVYSPRDDTAIAEVRDRFRLRPEICVLYRRISGPQERRYADTRLCPRDRRMCRSVRSSSSPEDNRPATTASFRISTGLCLKLALPPMSRCSARSATTIMQR